MQKNRRRKAGKHAARTREALKFSRLAEAEAQAEAEAAERIAYMDNMLANLAKRNIPFGDLLQRAMEGADRGWLWDNIFKQKGSIRRVLDILVSSRNSPTGRAELTSWAIDVTCGVVYREGEETTKSGILRVKPGMINAEFIRQFDCLDLLAASRRYAHPWSN